MRSPLMEWNLRFNRRERNGLHMADLELLRGLGTVVSARKEEIIFMEDDPGDSMYIVLKGLFGVYVNSFVDFPMRIADVGQGSFFGEMSVIDGWPRSATVLAEEDGAVLSIGKDKFSLLLEKSPEITESILATLRSRADSTSATVRGMGKDVPPVPSVPEKGQRGGSVDGTIAAMTALARYIREMNRLLYEPSLPKGEAPQPADGAAQPKDYMTLLPDGYKSHNKRDENNNKDNLYVRKVICPYCLNKSEALVPKMPALQRLRVDSDGRVIYKDFDILLYTNVVCPNCNFTDSFWSFSKFRQPARQPRYVGNQFKNVEGFTGYDHTHIHSVDEAVLSYYLNLRCLERATNIRSEPLRFAKAWIRLYWIYSDLNEPELQKTAAERSIKLYDTYLGDNIGIILRQDEMRVNMLLGELSAAIGSDRQASKYFEANILLGRNTPAASEIAEESQKRYKELSGG